jgi:signal transduction histidine kinase
VLNAIQAMPEGGHLQISLFPKENEVVALFQDDGPGIPRENLQKIFDPFFTTRTEGIGLGLAITQRIIEDNAGRMEVESRVGDGTCFSVYLPAAPSSTTKQPESP